MLIGNESSATREIDAVVENIEVIGLRAHPLGDDTPAIRITGNTGVIDGRRFFWPESGSYPCH
jgi:hypothetical protein